LKTITRKELREIVRPGSSTMIGGFLGCGTPDEIIDELIISRIGGLTVIANDTAFLDRGIGRLVVNRLVRRAIVSHIGTNPETQRQMIEGEIEVELVPQGTLAERVRARGVGLGGILTPTGVGTVVEEGKETIVVGEQKYLLELPIGAEFALIKAKRADYCGNLSYSLTARNFNPLMAMAAECVIAEVEEIVPVGSISPEEINTPGVIVDYILVRGCR
jgi:acetate CoA/acetoacetate CoA-transferase alpha subunit